MDKLYRIGEWLEQNKSSIIKEWLSDELVVELFAKHKISLRKFSENYAVGIVTHTVNVMQSKVEMANCPIMNKFVDFMIQKDIKSEEILMICAPLRSTVVLNLLKSDSNIAKDVSSMKIVLKIFDTNLSGVFKNYDDAINKIDSSKTQQNINLKTYLNRLQTILNAQDNIIFKLHGKEIFIANKALFNTTGVDNLKEFKSKFTPPLSFIKSVDLYDTLFQNEEYDKWITKVIQQHKGRSKIKLFNTLTNQTSIMNIKITQLGELNDYIFTLQDITKQHNKISKLNEIAFKDSLTNLNNLKGFEKILENKLKNAVNNNLKILMIELKGLRLYKEQNSEEESEKVIKNIAETLTQRYKDDSARIDYNRFVVLSNELTLDDSNTLVQELEKTIASSPNSQSINIGAAIVLLHDADTTSKIIDRGELLLNYMNKNSTEQVIDHQTIDKEEVKRLKEEEAFLSLMKEYKTEKKTLPATNYYLEIPLKSPGKILQIAEHEMILNVRKISAVALNKNDYIYLEMPHKPNFRASIKSVDMKSNNVVLHNFKAVESSPLERINIHVKLSQPREIILKSQKVQILEELETVSIGTFVVLANHLYDIQVDSELKMSTTLTDTEEEYTGRVFKIIPVADKFKLIIHLEATTSVKNALTPFISNRQIEIIKKLQDKTSY